MPVARTCAGFQRLTGRSGYAPLSPRPPGFDWPRPAAGRRDLGPSPVSGEGVGRGMLWRSAREKRGTTSAVSGLSPLARQAGQARKAPLWAQAAGQARKAPLWAQAAGQARKVLF